MANPDRILSLDDLLQGKGKSSKSFWVFADDNVDYLTRIATSQTTQFSIGDKCLRIPSIKFVTNYNGADILEFDGSQIYDDKGLVQSVEEGKKYNTKGTVSCGGGLVCRAPVRLYIERVQLGGGGINMLRALSQHSKDMTKLYTSLHVDNHATGHGVAKLERIVQDYQAHLNGEQFSRERFRTVLSDAQKFTDWHLLEILLMQMNVQDRLIYVGSEGGNEAKNLVIYQVEDEHGRLGIHDKIILRGTKITNPIVPQENNWSETNVGTIVINSTSSPDVFAAAMNQYRQTKSTYTNVLGIVCLTEKMDPLYAKVTEEAISNRFITIFNETEVLKYWSPKRDSKLDVNGIYLNELFEAIKKVWQNQGENHSRVYVTLGNFGCLGVDENGDIYRVSVFKFDSNDLNTNGAGDTFASVVARLEHERRHNGIERDMLDIMALASGTAAYLIESQNSGRTLTETNIKGYLKNKELNYEVIGNIEGPGSQFVGKLSQHPISSKYEVLKCK